MDTIGVEHFADRHDAGSQLAKVLIEKYKDEDVLVLGIPRGGVIVAYEIALAMNAELSAIITKKLRHPMQEELAIGAIAEDGSIFLTSLASDIPDSALKRIVANEEGEIKSRVQRFREGKPLPDMRNKTVIIADDGIATGSTLIPAIKLCKSRRAAKVVVASPVSGSSYVSEVDSLADAVVILTKPEDFFAVGQVYDDFHDTTDAEVVGFLNEFERHRPKRKRALL